MDRSMSRIERMKPSQPKKSKNQPPESTPPRKLTKKERDEHFAAHLPGVLAYHQTMLADGLRNKLLYKAVKQSVTPETAFLDVGAGTGVWAILAAKLGAKRVVAVEVEECLIPVIYKHAQENGVADRIEIIHGKSDDVRLKGRFDVIVSELFGNAAFGDEVVRSFVDIRSRFLAPGGVLIPQKLALAAVPVHFKRSIHEIPAELPLSCNFLRSIKLNYSQSVSIADRKRLKPLAAPQKIFEIDFRDIEMAPKLTDLRASWKLADISQANGFATSIHSTFTDKIDMNSLGSQSWGTALYQFVPFEGKAGELNFSLNMDAEKSNWTVSSSLKDSHPQSYSPIFAFTRMRMTQEMTPYRRFKPKVQKPAR
jgi:SAM-dependent methyltransferase